MLKFAVDKTGSGRRGLYG